MSRDLRLYSLSLAIVLMLWFAPVRADYGAGSGCPALAIPVDLNQQSFWASHDEQDYSSEEYRDLCPATGTTAYASGGQEGVQDCEIEAGGGTYYDGANHMWVLDGSLTCAFNGSNNGGEFRTGWEY